MDRRNALKIMGGTLAYGFAATSLTSVFVACKTDPAIKWEPGFFSLEQATAVEEIMEIILPETDTPGAKEAGVMQDIDSYINSVMLPEDKEEILQEFTSFLELFQTETGKPFAEATPEEKSEWILNFANQVPQGPPTEAQLFFNKMKGMGVSSYFSSELIGKNHLAYESVPGEQRGCVSLEEATGGLTWAL